MMSQRLLARIVVHKKAFDTINNNILLSNVELYGINGNSLDWFRSYLKKRKQACSVNTTKEIQCGVPQEVPLALCYSSST